MAAEVGIHDYMMLQDARWTFFYSPRRLFDGPMGLGKVQRAQSQVEVEVFGSRSTTRFWQLAECVSDPRGSSDGVEK